MAARQAGFEVFGDHEHIAARQCFDDIPLQAYYRQLARPACRVFRHPGHSARTANSSRFLNRLFPGIEIKVVRLRRDDNSSHSELGEPKFYDAGRISYVAAPAGLAR